jgi:hypothetical protein
MTEMTNHFFGDRIGGAKDLLPDKGTEGACGAGWYS